MGLHKATDRLDLSKQILLFKVSDLKSTKSYVSIMVLVFSGIFFLHDLYIDIVVEGKPLAHMLLEGGVFFAIMLVLLFEIGRVLRLSTKVSAGQAEITRFKTHLLQVIRDEFNRWGLTDAEQDIALMLIKGLSMQEIAEARNTKEKSVRQRATGIYAKAGVTNRYELVSYFIEDLIAPETS